MKRLAILLCGLLLLAAYPSKAEATTGFWSGVIVGAVATAVIVAYCDSGHPIYHGHSVCAHRHPVRRVVTVRNPPGPVRTVVHTRAVARHPGRRR